MSAPRKPSRNTWIALSVLLGWNLIVYHRVLFFGEVPDGGDQNYLHYPWKTFLLNSIRGGLFPFWNPYPFCGTPFYADLQTCALYPPDWIYFFVPLPWGFGLSYFLHSFAAASFFYLLSGRFVANPRGRLLSALIYSGSGTLLSRLYLGNAVVIASYAWAPLFFECAVRLFECPSPKRVGALGIVSALFILAGHPQIPFLTVQLLFAFLVFQSLTRTPETHFPGSTAPSPRQVRRRTTFGSGTNDNPLWKRWLAVASGGLLGLGITMVQVGPFLELAGYSATRAGGATYEFASEGSMPVSHLLTLFLPLFFGDPTNATYWGSLIPFPEICGYIGTISLFLLMAAIVLSRRSEIYFLGGVALIAALLALGEFTPVHRVFYEAIPGWDLFRQPGRSLFLFTFAGALLAGFGFEDLERESDRSRSKAYKILGITTALTLILLIAGGLYLKAHRDTILEQFAQTENAKVLTGSGVERVAYVPGNFLHRYDSMQRSLLEPIVYLSGFAGALIGWKRAPNRRVQIGWILILLLGIDLYRFGHRFLSTLPESEWRDLRHPPSELATKFSAENDLGRLLQPDTALDYRFHERHPEFYPNGPMAQGIRTVRGYSATILAHYSRFINTLQGRNPEEPPGGLLILDKIDQADPLGLAVMGARRMIDYQSHGAPFHVIEKRREGLYVHALEVSLPRCFRAIPSDNRWGLLPVERSKDLSAVIESNPNRVVVRTSGETPAELVFTDCRFPGWRATVKNEATSITEAFIAFQKVSVPAGESEVIWEFKPTGFETYAIVSIVSLLGCFLSGFWLENLAGRPAQHKP